MQTNNYEVFIILDKEEMSTLRRALNLMKVSSAILDYAENIETCEILENKIEHSIFLNEKRK